MNGWDKPRLLARLVLAGVVAFSVLAAVVPAHAQTFKFANQGDAISMDPHSLNESLQLSVTGNIYEPLVARGKSLELVPGLATDWKQTSPTVWRFNLRKGVTFHDGTPFSADDVIFSYQRARGDGSDVKTYVQEIAEIRKINDSAIDVVTKAPFPILPDVISLWYIMSKKWCEDNRAVQPVDKRKGIENTASFRANGTGPFRLRTRDPGVRTTMVRNFNYWNKKIDTNVDEVIFTPIGNASTRVAALLSGEIDMMEPVPVQDVGRVGASPNLKVMQGPELRTIFLGMDQKRDELLSSSVKGKNPFKDKRVRQAFYQAIDEETIKARVMRGAATPTAEMVGPGVRGFRPDMNKRPPHDVEAAKKLLADAGYPNGFEVTMDCPNDRYVNDAAICQAVVGMLARVGIKVDLLAEPKSKYFARLAAAGGFDTSFYLQGWTPSTLESFNTFSYVFHCRDEKGNGAAANLGGYCNPKLDELAKAALQEPDESKRDEIFKQAWQLALFDDVSYVPLHQQALAWGVSKRLHVPQRPDNYYVFAWARLD